MNGVRRPYNLAMPYVESTDQLVVELLVRDLEASRRFYESIGFEFLYEKPGFVALGWEGHKFFLDAKPDLPPPEETTRMNVRVMVPDVDRQWERCNAAGAIVIAAIADRPYGLRDFTVRDPDGFGVRFATRTS